MNTITSYFGDDQSFVTRASNFYRTQILDKSDEKTQRVLSSIEKKIEAARKRVPSLPKVEVRESTYDVPLAATHFPGPKQVSIVKISPLLLKAYFAEEGAQPGILHPLPDPVASWVKTKWHEITSKQGMDVETQLNELSTQRRLLFARHFHPIIFSWLNSLPDTPEELVTTLMDLSESETSERLAQLNILNVWIEDHNGVTAAIGHELQHLIQGNNTGRYPSKFESHANGLADLAHWVPITTGTFWLTSNISLTSFAISSILAVATGIALKTLAYASKRLRAPDVSIRSSQRNEQDADDHVEDFFPGTDRYSVVSRKQDLVSCLLGLREDLDTEAKRDPKKVIAALNETYRDDTHPNPLARWQRAQARVRGDQLEAA